jgi:ribose 5-phosphate isomerase B
MKVAFGCDHGGFPLRQTVLDVIARVGHDVVDCGAETLDPNDDYPVFAKRVAAALQSGQAQRAVLICGSGVGASIAANKVSGVRAAICHDTFSARQGVEDDDMNLICLGARIIGPALASDLVATFLHAKVSGAERHRRRSQMVKELETEVGPTAVIKAVRKSGRHSKG